MTFHPNSILFLFILKNYIYDLNDNQFGSYIFDIFCVCLYQ